ncbi:MAG TPA: glycosyltransferase family 2 protein [Acidobacteriota bacterium]
MSAALVTVAVPTLNAAPTLPRLLRALEQQIGAPPIELLILDSGSDDATLELAQAAGARLVAIDRAGFDHGATRNRAVELSGADFIAFLSQDAVPADPHWLGQLLAPLIADPTVAATWSRHLPWPGEPFFERRELEATTTGSQATRRIGLDELRAAGGALNRVLVFANTASCVRAAVLREHPFPRADFAEDRAWQARVLGAGHQVVYVPTSRVYHSHAYGLIDNLRRNYDDGRSWLIHFGRRPYASSIPYPLLSAAEVLWCWLGDLGALGREPAPLAARLALALRSPLWHGSRVLGQWLGFRYSWWPRAWHDWLSLQRRRQSR